MLHNKYGVYKAQFLRVEEGNTSTKTHEQCLKNANEEGSNN